MKPVIDRRNRSSALRRLLIAALLAGMSQAAIAQSEYAAAWGPDVGAQAPMLAADDQNGEAQTLATQCADTLAGSAAIAAELKNRATIRSGN